MKTTLSRLPPVLPLIAMTLLLGGCDLVGDILEFGFWAAVIIVVVIVALVWWVARRIGRSRRRPPPNG